MTAQRLIKAGTLNAQEVTKHDFDRQTKNWLAVKSFLERNNLPVAQMEYKIFNAYNTHAGIQHETGGKLVGFKLHAPGVLWNKYENGHAQSGTNHITINHVKVRMTAFVRMSPEKQDALLA